MFCLTKPDSSPDWIWSRPMKKIFLATVAVIGFGIGAADAQTASANMLALYHAPAQNYQQNNWVNG
jgi:hypothetical protein